MAVEAMGEHRSCCTAAASCGCQPQLRLPALSVSGALILPLPQQHQRSTSRLSLSLPWHPALPPSPPAVAFRIYDADDDGFVTRADLLRQLQQTNRRGLSPAQLEQIVGSTMSAFDADGDGQLCFQEFRALLSASSTERNKALHF